MNGFIPFAITNSGVIVGDGISDSMSGQTPFIYAGGVWSTFSVPGAAPGFTTLTGVNSKGQIVGDYADTGYNFHGFFYDGSNFHTIDYPGASITSVSGINNNGLIVGGAFSGSTVLTTLGGFTYLNGTITPLPSQYGPAVGVNDSGAIITQPTPNSSVGYLLQNNQATTISDPNAGIFGTSVHGINNSNVIVGGYVDPSGVDHGFIYNNGTYTTLDDPQSTYAGPGPVGANGELTGINDLGQVVGDYLDANYDPQAFLATPIVPEPASLTLFSIAGCGAAVWKLRRRV
jgi:hypothetical protein